MIRPFDRDRLREEFRSAQPFPFFLVGAERSGTTLLRLMLDHHRNIAVPHEFDFAVSEIVSDRVWPDMDEYRAFLARDGSFLRSGFPIDDSLDYPSLVESFLRARQGDATWIGMAVHHKIDRLPRLWPGARYIHVLRDPRDVARSVVGMGWAGNAWAGVQRWTDAEEAWERLQGQIQPGRFIEVRYEELVSEPVSVLQRICEFLAVEYDAKMLSYPEDSSYGWPNARLADQWQTRMSTRDVQLVEGRLDSLLRERGYTPSDYAPLRPGPLESLVLRLTDRWGRLRFRAKRLGIALVLADIAARRADRPEWVRATAERIQRIEERHIR